MMKREEIQHLLGGYAAGTLTPSEQQLLFSAAMEDQALFDALADEQALKEILDDPESRGFLRAALEEVAPKPVEEKKKGLSWWWPAAGSLAAASLALVMIVGIQRTVTEKQKVTTVATHFPDSAKGASPNNHAAADRDGAAQPVEAPKAAAVASSAAPARKADAEAGAKSVAPPPVPPPPSTEPKPVVRVQEEAKVKKESSALDMETRTASATSKDAVADKKKASVGGGPVDAVAAAAPAAERPREADSRKPAAAPAVQVAGAARPPAQPLSQQQTAQAPPSATAVPEGLEKRAEPQQQIQLARDAVSLSASQLYLSQAKQNQAPATTAFRAPPRFASETSTETTRRDSGQQQQPQAPAGGAPAPAPAQAAGRGAGAASGALAANRLGLTAQQQQNMGIRYQILRRNSQGQYVQTRLDTRFEAGDEIAIQVDKNAGGIVAVSLRPSGNATAPWTPVAMASQTLFEARTAPIRLAKGTLDLSIVLSPDGGYQNLNAPVAAGPRQISETAGNAVYVVVPGAATTPVAATLRIQVN